MQMTDKNGETQGVTTVGSRVHIKVRASDTDDVTTSTGVVIEDYQDLVIDRNSTGRDWAHVHRWAIALDDGRLIFANDEDLVTAG